MLRGVRGSGVALAGRGGARLVPRQRSAGSEKCEKHGAAKPARASSAALARRAVTPRRTPPAVDGRSVPCHGSSPGAWQGRGAWRLA